MPPFARQFSVAQPSVRSALKLRGGLADIDGEAVAKLFVTLAGVDAALETVSGSESAADVAEGWAKDGAAAAAVGYYLFANAVLSGGDTSKAVVLGSLDNDWPGTSNDSEISA